VLNRLEGEAVFVLPDKLRKVSARCLKNAKALAQRVAELGGAITDDPSAIAAVAEGGEFVLPESNSDVAGIVTCALAQTRIIITNGGATLALLHARDELTHLLLLKMMRHEVALEADLEAALAGNAGDDAWHRREARGVHLMRGTSDE
jgi:ferritin-like protein